MNERDTYLYRCADINPNACYTSWLENSSVMVKNTAK